ncbi:MAG: DMT family transporter [Anaerolineaceae bacterium]|nr:DMT family transporter [Anaerolineaceae bacterium]
MIFSGFFGAFLALSAAGLIGASDFCGGLASRRGGELRVTVVSAIAGSLLLSIFSLIWRESWLSWMDILWSALAGVCGSLAVITIYRGLTMGNAAAVAPIAGVIGAALPAAFGMLTQGLPPLTQLAGFLMAFPGIALVSQSGTTTNKIKKEILLLAVLSGIFAAGFFTFLSQVTPGTVVLPSLIAKIASFSTAMLLIIIRPRKDSDIPFRQISPLAILGGVLDSAASAVYILAQQHTRLDVAVVLTSLYPAATIMLAYLVQKEHISRRQWTGIALCLTAIVLIVI